MSWLIPLALMAATFLAVFVIIGWQAAVLGLRHQAQVNAPRGEFDATLFALGLPFYAGSMYTLEVSDEELRLLRAAIGSCVRDYGHDEADVIEAIRGVLGKLESATADRR